MSAHAMIRDATGLNVSHSQADRAIRQRMDHTGATDREHYLATLSPAELAELVELLVVPESWMFRDPQAFHATVDHVQARLARNPRPVRILSVPCAGGEEPYSIAMALFDAGIAASLFGIDAIDLSAACVTRARAGIYGRNAFRNKDLSFRDRYFDALGGDLYRINGKVRSQVRISQGNLLSMDTAALLRYYDVIFCRNLLIYFDKPTAADAIARLSAMLDDNGILLAGHAEVPTFTQHGFTPLPQRFAFALKKDPAPALRYAALPRPGEFAPARVQPVRSNASAGNSGPVTAAPVPSAATVAAAGAIAASSNAPTAAGARAAMPSRPAHADGAQRPPAGTAPPPPLAASPHDAGTAPDVGAARALADRGQHAQAAALCQAVLAADPHSQAAAEAYFILGMLREQAQDAGEAEQLWRRCIYLRPDHYEALCHLALLAEQQGDVARAANLKARARRIYQRANATRAES